MKGMTLNLLHDQGQILIQTEGKGLLIIVCANAMFVDDNIKIMDTDVPMTGMRGHFCSLNVEGLNARLWQFND